MERKSLEEVEECLVPSRLLCCAQYRSLEIAKQASKETHVHNLTSLENPLENPKCWHCTHNFDWNAWMIPLSKCVLTNNFKSYGCFCSPSCAITWVTLRNNYNSSQIVSWIKSMAFERGIYEFSKAPNTHWLKEYGGTLTIEEFRNVGKSCKSYTEKNEPFISFPLILEKEQKITEAKEVTKSIKSKNKKATSQAMNSEELTTKGLYHEFLENNDEIQEADTTRPAKKVRKERAKKEKKTAQSGTLQGLIRKRKHHSDREPLPPKPPPDDAPEKNDDMDLGD